MHLSEKTTETNLVNIADTREVMLNLFKTWENILHQEGYIYNQIYITEDETADGLHKLLAGS